MGLTGTLRDGTQIVAIKTCEFEGRYDADGVPSACGDAARYRVLFPCGVAMNACEEHAQILWDVDDALHQTVDAVDPQAGI